jgi:hypothetical protein
MKPSTLPVAIMVPSGEKAAHSGWLLLPNATWQRQGSRCGGGVSAGHENSWQPAVCPLPEQQDHACAAALHHAASLQACWGPSGRGARLRPTLKSSALG